MKNLRQAKITAIVCIFSILFISGMSTAQNTDRVTTPESEVFISTAKITLLSLFILQMAIFLLVIKLQIDRGY